MSDVERRHNRRSKKTDSRRAGVYVDYKEDTSKRSGIYVEEVHEKPVPNNMDETEDERAPLLRKQERLERQIISEINKVDAGVDDLLPHADNLMEATNRYFGDDGKVLPRKRPCWKRICCCCC